MALRVHLSPPVLRVESPMRRSARAVRGGAVVRGDSTTAGLGAPEPFGVPPLRSVCDQALAPAVAGSAAGSDAVRRRRCGKTSMSRMSAPWKRPSTTAAR